MKSKITIPIPIVLETLDVEISVLEKEGSEIVGFAELSFMDSSGNCFIKGKGFTIKFKIFKDTGKILTLDAPAYKTGYGFKKSFIIDDKALWDDICHKITSRVKEMIGNEPENHNESIDVDEVPF